MNTKVTVDHLKPWFEALVCPHCRTPLKGEQTQLTCTNQGCTFPIREGIPTFLDSAETKPALDSPDARAMVAGYRTPNAKLIGLRRWITSEYFPGKAWRRAKQDTLNTAGPVLIIGSGVTRYSGGVHLDLDDFPGVDVVADAGAIPFRENSFTGAVCEVVLEHVTHPDQVIAETFRVLQPGGRCFFIVPFLFPFHGHPGDYRRWSRQGLAEDFAAFQDLETGIHGGPCSAIVNLLSEWLYVLSGARFPKGYVPIKGAATALLFPLKFLDLVVNRFPEAHRLAATLFVTGTKPVN